MQSPELQDGVKRPCTVAPSVLPPEVLETIAGYISCPTAFMALLASIPRAAWTPRLQCLYTLTTVAGVRVRWPTIYLDDVALPEATWRMLQSALSLRVEIALEGIACSADLLTATNRLGKQSISRVQLRLTKLAMPECEALRDALLGCTAVKALEIEIATDVSRHRPALDALLTAICHPHLAVFELRLCSARGPHRLHATFARYLAEWLRFGRATSLHLNDIDLDLSVDPTLGPALALAFRQSPSLAEVSLTRVGFFQHCLYETHVGLSWPRRLRALSIQ
ncbi:hypothetical protein SDRG_17392 [Saprolegnia diclina VS20]|uniref:F-box domain-containing protein n=1 Tax=Saprolegnia diclina (strain VS20) TaxID=1156394 RepID=T0PR69_SAPDV|nr:hypothetical protein SDRG_17392 [Saprolegnia diclina VS20]XP_008621865.1 hypothetical protein SDRG_17401 [Saprolegnia diclina VS20]EQC24706.1 hypothetical protein SDRG_17401 [Saprolegnia diclina VS20]EQC24715.1 hypothetical protein SDRG_17392 [Saprolegnia diclina VS20]|eukprot:XP_008621856.1 hypothetical protein SDRG_17392 [Saprolegnia diclina VS20]